MNHFSCEVMAKEKIKNLQAEGMQSQAFCKSALQNPEPLIGLVRNRYTPLLKAAIQVVGGVLLFLACILISSS